MKWDFLGSLFAYGIIFGVLFAMAIVGGIEGAF
jgi:hypothetical protein